MVNRNETATLIKAKGMDRGVCFQRIIEQRNETLALITTIRKTWINATLIFLSPTLAPPLAVLPVHGFAPALDQAVFAAPTLLRLRFSAGVENLVPGVSPEQQREYAHAGVGRDRHVMPRPNEAVSENDLLNAAWFVP